MSIHNVTVATQRTRSPAVAVIADRTANKSEQRTV